MSDVEDKRLRDDLEKIKHVCKCGHPVYFSNKNDFSYCNFCWRRIYKDEATEFKHKILKAMGQGTNDSRRFSGEANRGTIPKIKGR